MFFYLARWWISALDAAYNVESITDTYYSPNNFPVMYVKI